jgi:hypothetical protein
MEMLVVLDQTRPDIGLRVAKVIVPGMRHMWGSSLLVMVRSGGINRLNPYLARDLID